MIRSMTGYGTSTITESGYTVSVEVRSVNHKYLDQTVRLPKKLNKLEGDIRAKIKERIIRGKVEVYITLDNAESETSIRYNESVAEAYMDSFAKMSQRFGIANDVTVSKLASLPDVYEYRDSEPNEEVIRSITMLALDNALEYFVVAREHEGKNLQADLLAKLDEMERIVGIVEERSPEIIDEYRSRLRVKAAELIADGSIDESRIAAEVVLYADKICVDEELVRLKSHISEARHELTENDEVGRKLDFIAQEMNRESNTILSKSTDVSIADCGIELKTLIEKLREQIQNLE